MTTSTPSQRSPCEESIKVSIDARIKCCGVNRQVDGAPPHSVPKTIYDEILSLVVKQQTLTYKVVTRAAAVIQLSLNSWGALSVTGGNFLSQRPSTVVHSPPVPARELLR